jgi:hypothetical protein
MSKQLKNLEVALGVVQRNLDALRKDLFGGRMGLDELKAKYEPRFDSLDDAIEDATKLPEVDLVIVIAPDGAVINVHSKTKKLECAVMYEGQDFDKFESFETVPFSDYEDLVDELTAETVPEA